MPTFEEQQLPGITPRLIFWIIGCTMTICGTVMGTYFSLKNSISSIQIDISSAKKDIGDNQTDIATIQRVDTLQTSAIYDLRQDMKIVTFKVDEMYSPPKSK